MKYISLLLITSLILFYGSLRGRADQENHPVTVFSGVSINTIKLVNVSPDKKYAVFSSTGNNIKSVYLHDRIGKEGFKLHEIYNNRVVLVEYKGALVSKRIVIQFDPLQPWNQRRFTYYPNAGEMPQKTYIVPSYGKGNVKGNNFFSTMKGRDIKQ